MSWLIDWNLALCLATHQHIWPFARAFSDFIGNSRNWLKRRLLTLWASNSTNSMHVSWFFCFFSRRQEQQQTSWIAGALTSYANREFKWKRVSRLHYLQKHFDLTFKHRFDIFFDGKLKWMQIASEHQFYYH